MSLGLGFDWRMALAELTGLQRFWWQGQSDLRERGLIERNILARAQLINSAAALSHLTAADCAKCRR